MSTHASLLSLSPASRSRVMVDVDGILFPWTRAFSTALGGSVFEEDDCPSWAVYPLPVSKGERARAMAYAHSREAILGFGLYPGAADGVRALRAAGLEVHIVTRRSHASASWTADALREIGVEFDGYAAAPDLDKTAWCLENDVALMLDDKPSTIEEALAAGLTVLSLGWSYNAHLSDAGLIRARDWEQLRDLVLAEGQTAPTRPA